MSTEVVLMASPAGKHAHQTTLSQAPAAAIAPATPPQLPQKHTLVPAHDTTITSSRESTPLSSVMDVDNMSTEPSSPPSAKASASKPGPTMPEPGAKKQKLTWAEKEVLRIEKHFKEQQKAEEKARKEAEKEAEKREREERKRAAAEEKEEKKRQQEAEKAQKRKEQDEAKELKRKQQEEVREEKRKVKEEKDAIKQAEVAAKEAEKKAKADEKAKKERAQLRLGAFFVKTAPSVGSAASSRRNSVSSILESSPVKPQLAPVVERLEKDSSDYEKAFPPFFLQSHTVLAPYSRFEGDDEHLQYLRGNLDSCLSHQEPTRVSSLKRTLEEASHDPEPKRRKLGSGIVPVKHLIAKINSTEAGIVDLTGPANSGATSPIDLLSNVSVKYLKYAEDVRPPYIGTYTKRPAGSNVKKICRNPFTRALPMVNYDYDSEAEWEEPEEGDSCETDDEDSDPDEDDEDMAGFLDDEDDAPKRRNVMGDIVPVYTPMFWQEAKHRRGPIEVEYGKSTLDLNAFRISPLMVEAVGTIDPFSTSYWRPAQPPAPAPTEPGSMAPPPRAPLNPLLGANSRITVDGATGLALKPPPAAAGATATGQKPKAAAKPFPTELLDEFKKEIEGSDLSKVGLIEVLKKKFPQVTGKTIQETLPLVATRDAKAKPPKWVLN